MEEKRFIVRMHKIGNWCPANIRSSDYHQCVVTMTENKFALLTGNK